MKSKGSGLMAKPKSFLISIDMDVAKHSHNCQHNSKHRIYAGDVRIKLKSGRKVEYFCVDCALDTINRDIETLNRLKESLNKSHRSVDDEKLYKSKV